MEQLRSGRSFAEAWRGAVGTLPAAYQAVLAPLGEVLTGGDADGLIKLTREEVYRIAGEKRQAFQQQSRLVTAMCLSASLLLVVVLI